MALLTPSMTPRSFVDALLEAGLYIAAIEVVAQALPRRLGLWWALLCAQHATAAEDLPPAQINLFRLALLWLRNPVEPVRAKAAAAAQEAGAHTLGGLLGYAVAMHSSDDGAVAIANAVKLACVAAPPKAILKTQHAYAMLGLQTRIPDQALADLRLNASLLQCV